jgi:hypothetical protein
MIGLSAHDIGSITCNDATIDFIVKAIDLDSDGNIDILLSCEDRGKIYWYKNDGYQRFTEYLIGDVGNEINDFTMITLDQLSLLDFHKERCDTMNHLILAPLLELGVIIQRNICNYD